MTGRATTAVVLAGGLGSRMRRDDAAAQLDPVQAAAAARGLKAMIPDARGRPLLDHILSSLADGGITQVILVVPPDHDAIRDWYTTHPTTRVALDFVVQPASLGTANALLTVEAVLSGRDFLVLNADNLYPVQAIEALVELGAPGLIAFDPEALVAQSNIEATRIDAFAILDLDASGRLRRIIEKPDANERELLGAHPPISMNLWRFDAGIFAVCREVPRSSRGEFELPQAVGLAVQRGAPYRAVTMAAGVLDLSQRSDVAGVGARLAAAEITP